MDQKRDEIRIYIIKKKGLENICFWCGGELRKYRRKYFTAAETRPIFGLRT